MFSSLVIVFLAVAIADAGQEQQDKVCKIYGDPHVKTLDGKKIDLVGLEGEFLITKANGMYPYNFEIRGVATKTNTQRPEESRLTSVTIKAQFEGWSNPFTFYRFNATNVYNATGVPTMKKPGESDLWGTPGNNVNLKFKYGSKTVFLAEYNAAKKTIRVTFTIANWGTFGDVSGVCGDMDGNPDNDLQALQDLGLTVASAKV